MLAAGLPALTNLATIVQVILGFGLVVFLHEFGHFAMAKKNGVKVEKFAIGFDFFDLKLFSWRRGETEYVVGAFPLGGYVKMLGHNEFSQELDDTARDPRSFQARPIGARVQIIAGGVIANFASAFVLCFLATLIGYHQIPAKVGFVSVDALRQGFEPGDDVVSVNGKKIRDFTNLIVRYATAPANSVADVVVDRGGERIELRVPVTAPEGGDDGFDNAPPFWTGVELLAGSLLEGLPAEAAGVHLGDELLAVDGVPVRHWGHFQQLVSARPDGLTLHVGRVVDGERTELDLAVSPKPRNADALPKYLLGAGPAWPAVVDFVQPDSPAAAAGLKAGDEITHVADVAVDSWFAAYVEASYGVPADAPVPLRVRRDDTSLDVTVARGPVENWSIYYALPDLGIVSEMPLELTLGTVEPGGPAARAGLRPGDRVRRVAGLYMPGDTTLTWEQVDPVWSQVVGLLDKLVEPKITLEIDRGTQRMTIDVPVVESTRLVNTGYLGLGAARLEVNMRQGVVGAAKHALVRPWQLLGETVDGLVSVLSGNVSPKNFSGPVGIFAAMSHFARKSTGDLLDFLALLSVNLAVVNFLPIPVTDGGHFLFLMYEKFKGQRMDEEIEARFQWAGLVFILLLMIYVTFHDIGRVARALGFG